MPKIKYALEKGGPKRLEISWKGNWKQFTIQLDGSEIASIDDYDLLKAGQEVSLEDGSSLKVQLAGRSILPHLRVLKDGQPLSASGFEPAQQLGFAYKFTFLIGAVNLVAGLAGVLFNISLVNLPAFGLQSFVVGCLYLFLAFSIRRRSTVALSIAVGILALDLVLAIVFWQNLPRIALIAGVVFRIFVLLGMIQGFGAIQALKQNPPNS